MKQSREKFNVSLLVRCLTTLAAVIAPTLCADAAAATKVCAVGETETTVLIVRHAEKTCRRCDELSDEGLERANVLPEAARNIAGELDAVYHSDTKRNVQTVAHLEPKPHVEYTRNSAESDVAAEILSDRCGQNVLIAGHSTTAPMMLEFLGVPPEQIDTTTWFPIELDGGVREIYLDDFNDIFVVKVCGSCDSGRRILMHRNYGAATPDH